MTVAPDKAERKAAEKAAKAARKEHEKRVKTAEKALKRAEKDFAMRVHHAKIERERIFNPPPLARFQGVVLIPTHVSGSWGHTLLSPNIRASVDTAGNISVNRRVSATRLVAGGIIGGLIFPKKIKVDDRELYLILEGDGLGQVVTCNPNSGAQARQFALAVNAAAAVSVQAIEERRERERIATADFEAIVSDMSGVELAQVDVERVRALLVASGEPAQLGT